MSEHLQIHDPAKEAYEQGLFEDMAETIVQLRGAHETAQVLATKDSLTGLDNRRKLEFSIGNMLVSGKKVGLLFLDADKFKEVNDTYGHKEGDVVLKEVADILVTTLRKTDSSEYVAGRYGGDEFVGALDLTQQIGKHGDPKLTSEQRLLGARDRLQASVNTYAQEDPILSQVDGFGVSVGAIIWDGKMTPGQFIEAADAAMYRQKQLKKLQERD